MKNPLIYIAIITFFCSNTFAQKNAELAFAGYKGNYIYNFFKPASPAHPDGDVVGFRLDRKVVSQPNWQTLQNFSTPQSYQELLNNVSKAINLVYQFNKITAYSADEVWPKFKKTFTYDSVGAYLTQQHLAIAFNILLVDSGANKNTAYQYRVVQIKKDKSEGLQYITTPLLQNKTINAAKPILKTRLTQGGNIQLVFKAKATQPIVEALLIKRKEGTRSNFNRIEPFYTIEHTADSIFYTLVDENLSDDQLYHYTITPVNRFGGEGGAVSDTAMASLMDKNYLIPQQFTATTDSGANKTVLKWKFFKPSLVSVVKVFRSKDYEGEYSYIGSSNEGFYNDQTTVAGQKYYYYLNITDKLGQNSIRSAKIYALLQTTKIPEAPIYVNATKTKTGNQISWQDYAADTRGWYVYKTNQIEGNLTLLSDFIFKDVQKANYTFVDSSANSGLVGYAIVAENLSNLRSGFSKTSYIKATENTTITPTQIADIVKTDNKFRLFWRDDAATQNQIMGYNIYRKTDKPDFVKINKTPIESAKQSYTDSVANTGFAVIYKLAVINQAGEEVFSDEYIAERQTQTLAPSSVKVFMATDKKSVYVKWQPSQSKVAQYQIYRFSRGTTPVKIADVTPEKFEYKDLEYLKNQVIYYYIIAVGANGTASIPSNQSFINPEF
jgi:fibronectin type 3 domain-containing protein